MIMYDDDDEFINALCVILSDNFGQKWDYEWDWTSQTKDMFNVKFWFLMLRKLSHKLVLFLMFLYFILITDL